MNLKKCSPRVSLNSTSLFFFEVSKFVLALRNFLRHIKTYRFNEINVFYLTSMGSRENHFALCIFLSHKWSFFLRACCKLFFYWYWKQKHICFFYPLIWRWDLRNSPCTLTSWGVLLLPFVGLLFRNKLLVCSVAVTSTPHHRLSSCNAALQERLWSGVFASHYLWSELNALFQDLWGDVRRFGGGGEVRRCFSPCILFLSIKPSTYLESHPRHASLISWFWFGASYGVVI